MKKITSGITLLTLAGALAACGNPSQTTDKAEKKHTHSHTHEHHHMSKAEQKIHDGYFKDHQVKDRKLTDWEGSWQSVYPLLKDGSLDKVFAHKAEEDHSMTRQQYKDYYRTGYKTDISRIVIDGKTIAFYKGKDKISGDYTYDGKEILKYEKGNRGVRFIFKKTSGDSTAPKYVQFSDHNIAPKLAEHFHIFMGDDRAKLLKEMDNWPTYYFDDMSKQEIAEEMMAH